MKTEKQVKEMFPLKFKITKEIIKKGKEELFNPFECIGASSLKKATGLTASVSWGTNRGTLYSDDGSIRIYIGIEENIDMMEVSKPTTITFNIIEIHKLKVK